MNILQIRNKVTQWIADYVTANRGAALHNADGLSPVGPSSVVGADGDYALDSISGDVFYKAENNWTIVCNVKPVIVSEDKLIGIGTDHPTVRLEIVDTNELGTDILLNQDKAEDGFYPTLKLSATRGSLDVPLPVQEDDLLGALMFYGESGTNGSLLSVWITIQVDDTPTNEHVPASLSIKTRDDADVMKERLRITSGLGAVVQSVPPSSVASLLGNGELSIWVDEGSNKLKFAVKYTNGTAKMAELDLS